MPKGLMLLLPMLLALPGCALFAGGRPIVTTQSAGCSALIPADWLRPVEGAPLPGGTELGDWIVFSDQQTGRLDMANDRTISAIHIVTACEQRDATAVRKSTRGFWGRLFGS